MIKEYKVDEEKYREIYNTQYKKHPKWQRTAWIRKIISMMAIIIPILIEVYGINILGEEIFSDYFFIAIGVCWTLIMILIGYIRILRFKCDHIVNFKLNESLVLKAEYLENGYKPNGEGISTTYDVMRVRYDEIDKLVLNKYHQRLRLYGNIRDTRYYDYEKGKRDYSFKEKSRIAFYLYYENSEEFLKTLSEKSGVEIEIIDYPEE